MKNVYSYIASSNPASAEAVINSFNYKLVSRNDLGLSLAQLVDAVGEPAFLKIMEIHPDKDVILELYSPKEKKSKKTCNGCFSRGNGYGNFLNADGSAGGQSIQSSKETSGNTLANQTNVILLVSALFIATALIVKTK